MTEKIDRLFRFDMYPQEWITDFCDLEADAAGVAAQIIMLMYAKRGPIDNDAANISRKLKNLSARRCRSIVDNLVDIDFFQLGSDGKLTKRRVERELSSKRTHLEHSANGGRTRAENHRANKKNKDLASSDTSESLQAPSPSRSPPPKESHRVGSAISVDNSRNGTGRDFKISGSGVGSDCPTISDSTKRTAQRKHAPGWDMDKLVQRWWKFQVGTSEPVTNPDGSFISWCKRNIAGKHPP